MSDTIKHNQQTQLTDCGEKNERNRQHRNTSQSIAIVGKSEADTQEPDKTLLLSNMDVTVSASTQVAYALLLECTGCVAVMDLLLRELCMTLEEWGEGFGAYTCCFDAARPPVQHADNSTDTRDTAAEHQQQSHDQPQMGWGMGPTVLTCLELAELWLSQESSGRLVRLVGLEDEFVLGGYGLGYGAVSPMAPLFTQFLVMVHHHGRCGCQTRGERQNTKQHQNQGRKRQVNIISNDDMAPIVNNPPFYNESGLVDEITWNGLETYATPRPFTHVQDANKSKSYSPRPMYKTPISLGLNSKNHRPHRETK